MKGCLCKVCSYYTEIYDGTGNCEGTFSMTDSTCGCEFGIDEKYTNKNEASLYNIPNH